MLRYVTSQSFTATGPYSVRHPISEVRLHVFVFISPGVMSKKMLLLFKKMFIIIIIIHFFVWQNSGSQCWTVALRAKTKSAKKVGQLIPSHFCTLTTHGWLSVPHPRAAAAADSSNPRWSDARSSKHTNLIHGKMITQLAVQRQAPSISLTAGMCIELDLTTKKKDVMIVISRMIVIYKHNVS